MAPGAVAMGDWVDEVDAVLCFFLPGQAQGDAVAALLLGRANPSGRLPVTMPRRDNEIGFTHEQYPGTPRADGVQVEYSERLAVGYRWYHANPDVVPAFCFGHGLSFTEFNYSALTVTPDQARFRLRNTGSLPGTETI